MSRDGSIHDSPGFNRESGCFYAPEPKLGQIEIPEHPTDEDVERARRLVLDDIMGGFPLKGANDAAAEKAACVALFLGPFVRSLIDGPTPIHLFDAVRPGEGKTLLPEALAIAALGAHPMAMIPQIVNNEDEWRKALLAAMTSSPPYFMLDNLRKPLESEAFASALTAGSIGGRKLQYTIWLELPVTHYWIVTGNNVKLSNELSQRTILIHLDSGLDFPRDRDPRLYPHPELKVWARENRRDLVWAALVMARSWIAANRPKGEGPSLGSFESWFDVMSGILTHVGIPGLNTNRDKLRSYVSSTSLVDFLSAVYAQTQGAPFQARDVLALGQIYLHCGGDEDAVVRLGRMFAQYEGENPGGGYILRKRTTSAGRAHKWAVERVSRQAVSPTREVSV